MIQRRWDIEYIVCFVIKYHYIFHDVEWWEINASIQCNYERNNFPLMIYTYVLINTLGPTQNGRQFPDDIFQCIFLN